MELRGQQFKQFRDALLAAFVPTRFDDMLLFQLGRRRTDIALGDDQQEIVLRVIQTANYEGWVPDLLRAARESNPQNPKLLALAQQFARATDAPPETRDDARLERTIREANGMLDVVVWRTRLATIEHQICRIEISGSWPPAFGTGFLLGPDVLMTNYHVVEKVHKGQLAPGEVALRFDYALMADGITPNPGTVYKLADDWLVDHSEYSPLDLRADTGGADPPPDQLDYALLRVAGSPGSELVGGSDNEDPEAPPREWITPPEETYDFVPDTPMLIMQHPEGKELKLAIDMQSILGVNGNGTRVRYRTNTEPGSSGSPCFDADWNLIALHHVGDPNYDKRHNPEYNQGVPFAAILDLLTKRGKKQELRI